MQNLSFDWENWNIGEKIIVASTGLYCLSLFLPWVNIGFASMSGLQHGAWILLICFAYPLYCTLRKDPINKILSHSMTGFSLCLVFLYIYDKQVTFFGESINAAGSGSYLAILSLILLFVGLYKYENKERVPALSEIGEALWFSTDPANWRLPSWLLGLGGVILVIIALTGFRSNTTKIHVFIIAVAMFALIPVMVSYRKTKNTYFKCAVTGIFTFIALSVLLPIQYEELPNMLALTNYENKIQEGMDLNKSTGSLNEVINKDDSADKQSRAAYRDKVKVYDLRAKYHDSLTESNVPGVEFKIKNKGNKPLSFVEVTVYFKDDFGETISEETFHPINTKSFMSDSGPLKPGYIWRIEKGKFFKAENVPSEWEEGRAEAKVTEVNFSN